MKNLNSTIMNELFEEAYPKIMEATEEKSEYARLREAYFSGLTHYYNKREWHDVSEEPIPSGKVVWVRVIDGEFEDYPSYGTSVDDFDTMFPNGYKITHWQEILPYYKDEDKEIYHID